MSETPNAAVKVLSSASSFIERSIEFRYFLLFSCFILLLDSCLVIFYSKNILTPLSEYSIDNISAGAILFFLALFSFLMSCFFKFFRKIMQLALIHPYFKWIEPNRKRNEINSSDYTYPSLLEKKAIIKQDSFTLDRLNHHQNEQNSIQTNLDIGFGMTVLFIYNYFLLDYDISSLTQVLATYLEVDNGFWINRLINAVVGSYILLIIFIFIFSLDPESGEDKIYSPKND